jgi:hypothetical protein
VAPCSTADVQNAVTGFDIKLFEFDRVHKWPLDRLRRFFQLLWTR